MINPTILKTECCMCNNPAEWAGLYCQEHWELYSARQFWAMMSGKQPTLDQKIADARKVQTPLPNDLEPFVLSLVPDLVFECDVCRRIKPKATCLDRQFLLKHQYCLCNKCVELVKIL